MTSMTEVDIKRRRDAKRFNESVKLLAQAMNGLAIATLATTFILPAASGQPLTVPWPWIFVSLALHLTGHVVLRLLWSED